MNYDDHISVVYDIAKPCNIVKSVTKSVPSKERKTYCVKQLKRFVRIYQDK